MLLNIEMTKLGKRLRALFAEIPADCAHFYDLCCDHGFLGRAVLESSQNTRVIFNDINPNITTTLNAQLSNYANSNYQVHTGPAEEVVIDVGNQSTFVLAGVGDEQCITILRGLLTKTKDTDAVFIISPATKVAYVRDFLMKQGLVCLAETTVTENKRTYEIIVIKHATSDNEPAVSLTGHCWRETKEHQTHLEKMIQFYQSQLRSSSNPVIPSIIKGYQQTLKKIQKKP